MLSEHLDSVGDGRSLFSRRIIARSFALRAVAVLSVSAALAGPAAAQMRVVDYNVTGLIGNTTALQAVFAAAQADDKAGFAAPVSIFMCEEVHTANLTPLLNIINASAPPGVVYAAATYTNNNEDNYSGASALFYRTGMFVEIIANHADIYTQAGRYTDRWRLQLIGYGTPTLNNTLYLYGMHLKASPGSTNVDERLQGADAIRTNADALGAGNHILYVGDMNFYQQQ